MPFDAHPNFAYSTVAAAPVPALTGVALTVAAGDGALFAGFPFDAVVWPASSLPLSTNAEVVRVTGRAGDVLTITRAAESSSARAIVAGDQIAVAVTGKVLTDIEQVVGVLTVVTLLTGTVSYTPSASATKIDAEGIGGGGGGAGTTASGSTAALSVSAGGGGAAWSRVRSVANVVGSHTVAIGGGGGGGAAGANPGTAGGDTSLQNTAAAVILLAKGGSPGTTRATSGTAITPVIGGAGGVAASGTGDAKMSGEGQAIAMRFSGAIAYCTGGSAARGGTVLYIAVGAAASGNNGQPGNDYGGGGTGAIDTNVTARPGGAGAPGVLIVTEYA